MAYAFVQKGSGIFAGNVITWGGATTAGNLLVVAFVKAANTGEFVSSGAGNVNTSQPGWASCQGTINTSGCRIATGQTGDFASVTLLYLPGSANAGGDTTTTFTLAADHSGNVFIGAMEYSGIAATSPFINFASQGQFQPGTGANAMTSTAVTIGTVPALLAGFGFSELEAANGPFTGTGFTGRTIDNATQYIWGEDQRITTASSVAVTFTNASGATDTTISNGIAFAETGASSNTATVAWIT